jgi:hypothetical protein
MFKVLVFIAILVMVFIFPLLLVINAVKSLQAKGDKKGLRLLAIGLGFGLAYLVYTAFYPTDGICVDKYERYTSLRFPSKAEIVAKEASIINDIKGSFTDCYMIRMRRKDYVAAMEKIIAAGKFQQHDSFLVFNTQYRKVASEMQGRKYARVFSDGTKAYTFMGFLDDSETVLINIVGRQSEMNKLPPVVNHTIISPAK